MALRRGIICHFESVCVILCANLYLVFRKPMNINDQFAEAERRFSAKEWPLAEELCLKVLAQDARRADAINLLGLLAQQARQPQRAVDYFAKAITLKRDSPGFYSNLGMAFLDLNEHDKAEMALRCALRQQPDTPDFLNHLGQIKFHQGAFDESITWYRQAIARQPDHAIAHWNLSLALLLIEQWHDGWLEYEWRLLLDKYRAGVERYSKPFWSGERLSGKTLLIWAEQGLGDTLQFVRYLPFVRGRGGRVVLGCHTQLARLLRESALADQIIAEGEPLPPYDLQLPLLSLPRIFDTHLRTIPRKTPYLRIPPEPIEECPRPIHDSYKVGLIWAGDPTHRNNHNRSIPLEMLGPVLATSGVSFCSLQVGPATREIDGLPPALRPTDLGSALRDFTDTARQVERMDLVITVDTSVAHLAGALGKSVWVLVPFVPDWRWLRHRDDSPWYPTLRLFRQPALKQWAPVIHNIKVALAQISSRSSSPATKGR